MGGWEKGVQKTDTKGSYIRGDGTSYEGIQKLFQYYSNTKFKNLGTWLGGKKHGEGKQKYKDGSGNKLTSSRIK